MQISIGSDNVNFKPVQVKKADDLIKLLTSNNWTPAIFKDNYRLKDNFLSTDVIALDVDNEEPIKCTVEEAKALFAEYKHVILPTRNHQKEKNGEVKDRFRVLLFLERPITDEKEYYATWYALQKLFPFIDPACKDPSRLFYPSIDCVSYNTKGKLIEPTEHVESVHTEAIKSVVKATIGAIGAISKGELSRQTLKFLQFGAPKGGRHGELYKAARDYLQNNYTEDEFIQAMESMIERTGNWSSSELSEKDLSTIHDAFKQQPKHAARLPYQEAFNFRPIADVLNNPLQLNWLVDEFLEVGGVSMIAGDPKSGKSTLWRQLAIAVSRGTPFLGRKVKQGKVLYLSIEESEALTKHQFIKAGIRPDDQISIHAGPPFSADTVQSLRATIEQQKPALLIIDTLVKGLQIDDINNYNDVNRKLDPFIQIARDTGVNVSFIHHINKSGEGSKSVSGSTALPGGVDCFLLFKRFGRRRFADSSGRGILPFNDHELLFDDKTVTYTLGASNGLDDDGDF